MNEIVEKFISDGIITEADMSRLERFVRLFESYNKHTNLSAVRERQSIWLKHIVDSLMVLRFEQLDGKLLDIGTGGGLPGVPLTIVKKELDVTLLDSVGKKVTACEHFIERLELDNARAIRQRAEKLGQEEAHAKSYDIVISRATAYLPTLLAWSEQLMKPDGKIVLYKTPSSGELEDGNTAAKHLNLKLARNHSYELGGAERHLLVYVRRVARSDR